MHITIAYDFIYYRASREADMISASYSKCLHNTGVLARRHSWWWCWREVYRKWYSTAMWVVIEVGSGPREILSGRIFVRAPNKMGRIFADIMRPSVLPTVEFETTLLGWFLQYDSPHLRTNWYQNGWYLLQWPSKLDEASGTCGKYYFGRIFPLIDQCRPSVLPEFYFVKSRSIT